jgi:hypothetical protein
VAQLLCLSSDEVGVAITSTSHAAEGNPPQTTAIVNISPQPGSPYTATERLATLIALINSNQYYFSRKFGLVEYTTGSATTPQQFTVKPSSNSNIEYRPPAAPPQARTSTSIVAGVAGGGLAVTAAAVALCCWMRRRRNSSAGPVSAEPASNPSPLKPKVSSVNHVAAIERPHEPAEHMRPPWNLRRVMQEFLVPNGGDANVQMYPPAHVPSSELFSVTRRSVVQGIVVEIRDGAVPGYLPEEGTPEVMQQERSEMSRPELLRIA